MDRHHRLLTRLVVCAFALTLVLCLTAPLYSQSYRDWQFGAPSYTVSEGWRLEREGGRWLPVTFPFTLPDGDHPYVFHLPAGSLSVESQKAMALMLRIYDTGYTLYVAGEEVARYPLRPFTLSNSTANTVQFADLPEGFAQADITLVITPLLSGQVRYSIPAPVLGEKASLAVLTILKELPLLVVLLLIAVGSLTLLILFHLLRNNQQTGAFFYTCLFALVFACYSLMTTRTLQLTVRNTYSLYLGHYLLMALVIAPAVMILYPYVLPKYRGFLRGLCYLSLANFAAQLVISLLSLVDLRVMLPVSHGLLALVIISGLWLCIRSARSRLDGELKSLLISCLPMAVGAVVDLLRFYLLPSGDYPLITFQLGLAFYVVWQVIDFIRQHLALYRERAMGEAYRSMAYTDLLTSLKNRNAYEVRIGELQAEMLSGNIGTLWCFVADIDNLKHTNDTFDHLRGDQLIIRVACILRDAMGEGADLYRTGGDEYVAFLPGLDDAGAEGIAQQIDLLVMQDNERTRDTQPPISLSLGYDRYRPEKDSDLMSLIRRADLLMYAQKHGT